MAYSFNDHWIIETLRLRESLWGPLEDAAETGRARAQGGDIERRLHTRARLLAQRDGLSDTLTRWRQVARLILIFFALAAIVAGSVAAMGTLGSGGQPVNLALAVTALLGLNTLTFLFWAASFGMQTGTTGSLLADAWLKLTHKLARGPDAALLPRALLELMTRHRLSRWGAGILSHWMWTLALLSAILCLLVLLATRRYTFQWETTLLSSDTIIALVHAFGWLPSLLGFPLPSAEIVRASGGEQAALPESAHALWSAWLLGVVVVYGLIPRLLALVLSAVIMHRRVARLAIDPALPGLAELHGRLMPASTGMGIDAPAAPRERSALRPPPSQGGPGGWCLLGVELPADLPWPPETLATGVMDLGIIDTREQRREVLDILRRDSAQRLLVCCDARQTPDRGTLSLLSEFAALAAGIKIVLLPDSNTPARKDQWRQQLMRAGFTPEQLPASVVTALEWLSTDTPETST